MAYHVVKRRFMAGEQASLHNQEMKVVALKTFGQRLKSAMKEANVTQASLARDFKITPQAINQWTVAKIPPELTLDRWVSLSRLLNINLEWLCFGVGRKERADMNPHVFEMVRQFQQLEPTQQEVIMATIGTLLLQKGAGIFAEGKRP
jgi:transcriptional regulator with XRE-family HTH domain